MRNTSERLLEAHRELRDHRFDWDTVADANIDARVRYLLGPLADPDFSAVERARKDELIRAWKKREDSAEAGSPARRYARFAEVVSNARALRERYASVAADPSGFCWSDTVRYLPTIGLFSVLIAAFPRNRGHSIGRLTDCYRFVLKGPTSYFAIRLPQPLALRAT